MPETPARGNDMRRPKSSEQGDRVKPERPRATSLRARLRLAVIGAALLFLLLAAALGAMTRFLGKDAQYLREALESALVTKDIEVHLLHHDRANGQQRAGSTAARQEELARRLRRDLADVRRYINTADEERLVDELGRRIDAYLAASANGQGLSEREFLAALDSTERLIELNVEQASELLAQATTWYRVAIFVTLVAAIAVVLGLGGALGGFDRWVRRPLAAAASAIGRFGAGDRSSRAAEGGPAEVREIADTFNDMAATLARQEHDRIAFIGGVAHDLRDPVTAIQMANAMLDPKGPLHGAPSEQTRAILLRQTARLERIVADFLDAVRIHAGHLDIQSEPVNLGELVRESVEQYRSIATDHDLVVSIPPETVMVQGDAMRLGQVLNNLLSNAVKYSPRGGPIKVALAEEGGEVIVAVTDQGIGLQPEERNQIFEPFRRTGASRELVPGVGLGLSVSKRIVEAHGGRIEVVSTPGRGSTFRVHLPASAKGPPR